MVKILQILSLLCIYSTSCLCQKILNNNEKKIFNDENEYNKIHSKKEEFKKEIEFERNLEEDDGYRQIKIYVDTSYLKDQYDSKNNLIKFNEIEKSIEIARNTLQKLIKVKLPLEYNVYIENTLLTGFNINRMNRTVIDHNVNCDIIIFIRLPSTTQEESMSVNKEFFAIPNIIKKDEHSNNRPIAGYIIYGDYYDIKYIDSNNNIEQRIELRSSIFLHEMIHILGFMDNYFQYFNNSNNIFGEKEVNRLNKGNKIKKIVKSERILNIAENYFNCPKNQIIGIELENQNNTENLENSHWEARILFGDIMTS